MELQVQSKRLSPSGLCFAIYTNIVKYYMTELEINRKNSAISSYIILTYQHTQSGAALCQLDIAENRCEIQLARDRCMPHMHIMYFSQLSCLSLCPSPCPAWASYLKHGQRTNNTLLNEPCFYPLKTHIHLLTLDEETEYKISSAETQLFHLHVPAHPARQQSSAAHTAPAHACIPPLIMFLF